MTRKKVIPVDEEKMMEIERSICQQQSLIGFAKQSIILMLRESQGLTRPVCLHLSAIPDYCRAAAHGFVGFWYNPGPVTINDLLEEANSEMFFYVRGGKGIIIFLGDHDEALKNSFGADDVEQIQLESRFA